MKLKDKTVVVTGGARGIGKALCTAFAREGARVVVADLRVDDATSIATEIGGHAIAELQETRFLPLVEEAGASERAGQNSAIIRKGIALRRLARCRLCSCGQHRQGKCEKIALPTTPSRRHRSISNDPGLGRDWMFSAGRQ